MRKGMEPRRRRPPQETVVELGETTVFEEAGAKAEWRNTRLARRARCAREKKMTIKELDYKNNRRSGIGTKLMETILKAAEKSGARMVVLETQTFNFKAISFYKKHGFEIIGFDRYAYSNRGPEEHNMRVEMGKMI
jgi:GNAT superfamily N-acetyltransferase